LPAERDMEIKPEFIDAMEFAFQVLAGGKAIRQDHIALFS